MRVLKGAVRHEVLVSRPWIYHFVAGVLCALVLAHGIRATADLDYPYDTDHFRDMSQAQTIRDGGWFQDPFYDDESVWYNPLLPFVLAAVSYVTQLPIHIVSTRAGAYLNIAAPITFYVLMLRLAGPQSALASLVGFLFVATGPTWASATYTPWLFASVFAQPLFYLTLTCYVTGIVRRGGDRSSYHALTGMFLGLTLMAHTAPAIVAALIILAVTSYRGMAEGRPQDIVRDIAMIFGVGLLVAAPFLVSIVGRYGLQVRNAVPLRWIDAALPPDDLLQFGRMLAQRWLLNAMLVAGVAAISLGRMRRPAALVVGAWAASSLALFVLTNYVVYRVNVVPFPVIVPPHHFLMYERAAEMIIFGVGVAATASAAASILTGSADMRSSTTRAPITSGIFSGMILAIVLVAYPGFRARDDYVANPNMARAQFLASEFRQVGDWIRTYTAPTDVFLTAESAGLSLVGPAGRKSVLVWDSFSNPYVDLRARREAQKEMWRSLTTGDCLTFRRYARDYHVGFVMTAVPRTPQVTPGQCGLLPTGFPGSTLAIYRVAPDWSPVSR